MIGNARQPIPHALITKACPFECNRLIERKKTQLSDICSGKCGGNASALCLHKANRGYMSHQRGNYDFHLEHIKYIFFKSFQARAKCRKGRNAVVEKGRSFFLFAVLSNADGWAAVLSHSGWDTAAVSLLMPGRNGDEQQPFSILNTLLWLHFLLSNSSHFPKCWEIRYRWH